MLAHWQRLLSIFSAGDRTKIHLLLVGATLLGMIEVAGVASVMPFLAVVLNPESIQSSRYLQIVYQALHFESPAQFQVFLGVVSLTLLVVSNALSGFVEWFTQRFCFLRTHALCVRLLEIYLRQPYVALMQRNRAELHKILVNDVDRVVIGTLMAGIRLFSDLVATVFILAVLFLVDPVISTITFMSLGAAYLGLWFMIQRHVSTLGEEFPEIGNRIVSRTQEALDGIKEIKVAGRETDFVRRLSEPRLHLARNAIRHGTLDLIPSRVIETLAFGAIIVVTLYLLLSTGSSGNAIAMVAFYAFAAYRLVPKLKSVLESADALRYNAPALGIIREDFFPPGGEAAVQKATEHTLADAITTHDVVFTYPGNGAVTLDHLDLRIPAAQFTCIVGATGAGKSTTVDLLLGLLQPASGSVRVDGRPLDPTLPLPLQFRVGYVPQVIHLLHDTVAHNIAFGIEPAHVDMDRVREAARLAQIHDFIEDELEGGYQSMIGEGGKNLSGGQRQRIGLARALYTDPQLLILDEATNGLDARTERGLLDCLLGLAPRRTIVCISHRATVAARADGIVVIEAGRVVGTGTYAEISAESSPFRTLLETD